MSSASSAYTQNLVKKQSIVRWQIVFDLMKIGFDLAQMQNAFNWYRLGFTWCTHQEELGNQPFWLIEEQRFANFNQLNQFDPAESKFAEDDSKHFTKLAYKA